jgi:uncharacterized protein (TIGR04255 family)
MSESIAVIPSSGNHAIEVMAFGLEFDRQFDSKAIDAVETHYDQSDSLKLLLPEYEKLTGISVTVDGKSQSVNIGNNGLRMSKKDGEKTPAWVVDVRQNIISCSCFVYDRWVEARDVATEIILPISKIVTGENIAIQAIGLQYQDVFRVATNDLMRGTARLFRDDGEWLNNHASSESNPWHIHQGWFSKDSRNRRVHNLLNIDATLDVNKGECIFRVTGQHRLLNKTENGLNDVALDINDISPAWDDLHGKNKDILLSLISDPVSRQIGLPG